MPSAPLVSMSFLLDARDSKRMCPGTECLLMSSLATTMTIQDGLVTVIPSKGAWVNGLRVDLPATVLTSVSVRRMPDGSMLVHQKAGVTVWLGKDGLLDVMVGDDLAAMLCGACGNFDGDQTNDAYGSQGKTPIEKWRAQDFSPCSN